MLLNWIYERISRATVIILIYFIAAQPGNYFIAGNSVSKVAQS